MPLSKVSSAVSDLFGMLAFFIAITGYSFALFGETTISNNLVLIYFLFIAKVLSGHFIPIRSNLGIALLVAVCASVGAWVGYLLNPPSYPLFGHILLCIGAALLGWLLLDAFDVDKEIN